MSNTHDSYYSFQCVVINVGLDYLHKGCSLPIIHRDVKTQNILLGQNLQAKIADFGLCKTYLSETQTHISVTPAGSAGYMDPEYVSLRAYFYISFKLSFYPIQYLA